MKKIYKISMIAIFLIANELVFALCTNLLREDYILLIIFSLFYAVIIDVITGLFSKKINKRVFKTIMIFTAFIYIINFMMYKLLGNVLSFSTLKNGIVQANIFSNVLVSQFVNRWYQIMAFILPCVIGIKKCNKIDFEKNDKSILIIKSISLLLIYFVLFILINFTSNDIDIYNTKNLYYNIDNSEMIVKKFGLITEIRLDIQRKIFGFKEKEFVEYQSEEDNNIQLIDKDKYNILNLDFDKLEQGEYSDEVKEVSKFLKMQKPTNKNIYTGKYAGKNLIVFVAESFSNLAIREDLTPTLYKMANTGFQFSNFYTPLFPVSTADGEYMTDTALFPATNVWSIENVSGKLFPYVYGNIFKSKGYKTFAYHDYNYDYYKRNDYFDTMGYDKYLGLGNGLEKRMDFSLYPASDYEMVKSTVDDYINESCFLAYYMTISGHINYDKKNAMVVKNWDKVKDLNYSEKTKSYLATQIELDKALEELIERLRRANKLEDTVIIITGDHYPYGLSFQEMNELTNKDMSNAFERFKMPFIIFNGENENNVKIEKCCSSIDVLPTMLNLFGLEFDSRLLMGKDIFSDEKPLVVFSDRSFITEKGRYNSNKNRYEGNSEEKDDIEEIKNSIYKKFKYSRIILENDFYRKLLF